MEILKNLSTINSNFLFQPGTKQSTVAIANNIFAQVELSEDIPQEFGIYNLTEFLGAVSLFPNPSVDFDGNVAKIYDSNSPGTFLKYVAADKAILHVPTKEPQNPKYELTFDLTQEELSSILKAAAVIGAPDIQIVANDKGTAIKVYDRKNPASNDFQITINDVPGDGVFNLKVENLKLYPGDQKVSVSAKGLSRWENVAAKVIVFIALEAV